MRAGTPKYSFIACCVFCSELHVCHTQKMDKGMLNQKDMTETAKAVFNELSDEPATVGEIAQNTHLTRERCQLILTQLVMAGLSEYQVGCYKRLQ
ncbi:hypothetical protein [Buttiauxella gaviniae]|uniref:hypothetical protein n=1 Tax=Buttiauxella gaviniae TaxID=82990 RepID=UPI0039748B79